MKKPFKILVVDDDAAVLTSARLLLKQHYQLVQTLQDASRALELLASIPFDLVLLDMNFTIGEQEGKEGLNLIEDIKRNHPKVEMIAVTAYGDLSVAVEAMKNGVRDFITKPWENERLLLTIDNVLAYQEVSTQLAASQQLNKDLTLELNGYEPPIGKSQAFKETIKIAEKVAVTDAEVLITGENGTGKEVLANHIHQVSDRKDGPFIKVDLGALSENLFESELFGHKKGAFTDAKEDRIGKLLHANGGTIFLDEIGNVPLHLQSKLLSVLQQRKVTPVGSNQPFDLDVRLISATNLDISEAIESGEFRQDLLYRINTIEIVLPPLRERIEDIGWLATHFLERFKHKYRKPATKLSKQAFETLENYNWPGNIRELNHVVERAVILSDTASIKASDLNIRTSSEDSEASLNLHEHEKVLILKALERNNGNITHAAKELGIDRLALYRRLDKHGL